ncbi:unnamed protein product [Camellia sinensis]
MSEPSEYSLRSGPYLGEISALCFLHLPPPHLSSTPYLLAGTGSQLLLYQLETGKMVKSFHVFQGIRVHGITTCSSINGNGNGHGKDRSFSSPIDFNIAVFGERRVKLFTLSIQMDCQFQDQPQDFIHFHLNLLHLLPKFSHWVLDVCFLKDHASSPHQESCCLAIGCSDNSVSFWDYLKPKANFHVRCPDRCLLYSMRIWGEKVEALRIASGTIYNEIIVWKVVHSNHTSSKSPVKDHVSMISSFDKGLQFHDQQYESVHMCRLAGHEGSIFCIAWFSDGSKLISVSDDRSARLWTVHAERKEFDNFAEILGSHSVGPVLFGHSARVWDCCIFDSLIVTAGEDCTCRVWGLDGNQLKMIREHTLDISMYDTNLQTAVVFVAQPILSTKPTIQYVVLRGRGIWRCLYDPNSSLLVTAGFDSSIKAQLLNASLFKSSERHDEEAKELTDRTKIFTVRIPRSSEHIGLMNSKSEYVRCLHFAREDALYVATNNGYLYHAKLSNMADVKWTELLRVSETVPIVCMDLLSRSSSNLTSTVEDWVAVGDGKGHMTIVSIVGDIHTPKVGITLTWSAGVERQLLGTYWCRSLGSRFIFTSDPRGTLRLWRLGNPLQSVSHSSPKSCDPLLIAEFVSCFGIRIMCLDASFEDEVLVCGDLRGNLVVFPLLKDLLLGTSVAASEVKISTLNYFKGAHGISSVCSISVASFSSSRVEIHSTGGDGCICYLEHDRDQQNLEFLGMKQVKELSLVRCVFDATSSNDLTSGSYAVGFSSTNFLIWNLMSEAKVVQVPCGGWRRPYAYYLGDVPEIKNCFAFVKGFWVLDSVRKIYPQNLHLQFHGREMHSICFIPEDSQFSSKQVTLSNSCWIATGCEDGTVRLTRYLGLKLGTKSLSPMCDPEKENLCLYGFPSEQWEVNLPAEEVPPELPEPTLGINFARDGMQEKDWLSLVAVHSDAWLLSVAFYFGARFGFDKADRKRLFNMINDLPTIFEVVTGAAKKQQKEKSSVSNHSSNKSKSNSKVRGSESQTKYDPSVEEWSASSLLGEHVGGSAVRSICFVSKIHKLAADVTNMPYGINRLNADLGDRENPCLLISVGAKRVLTCWKQKNRVTKFKEEASMTKPRDATGSGFKPSSRMFSPMSFQWLSTDMPNKYYSTCEIRENTEKVGTAENVVGSDAAYASPFPEARKIESKIYLGDKYENDWRYLAVTAFLVEVTYSRLTVCFIIVACSDATLALRALLLPYRLWFDVALLVPLPSPVLALQHIIIPMGLPSEVWKLLYLTNMPPDVEKKEKIREEKKEEEDQMWFYDNITYLQIKTVGATLINAHETHSLVSKNNVQTGSVYLLISGSTDGSITFWDLTESVENFIRSVSDFHIEKSIDCQKRPRTGRGSQGGRWWKALGSGISTKNRGDNSVTARTIEGTGKNMLNTVGCGTPSKCTNSERGATACSQPIYTPSIEEEKLADSSLELCRIWPLKILNNIHQSGVNCLHISSIQNNRGSNFAYMYYALSGGDDQALHCLGFDLQILPSNQYSENQDHDIGHGVSESMNNFIHHGQNQNYSIRFFYHDKVASAHSSSVKGIWTDGCWVFSTGLDQRIRCWLLDEHGKLKEYACLIISVPEPEALDARTWGKDSYQIIVAGRGMQMVEFSTSCGMDNGD